MVRSFVGNPIFSLTTVFLKKFTTRTLFPTTKNVALFCHELHISRYQPPYSSYTPCPHFLSLYTVALAFTVPKNLVSSLSPSLVLHATM